MQDYFVIDIPKYRSNTPLTAKLMHSLMHRPAMHEAYELAMTAFDFTDEPDYGLAELTPFHQRYGLVPIGPRHLDGVWITDIHTTLLP